MVQIQSTWFPLYDVNPQTYVENIFNARASDYLKATQKIFRTSKSPSCVALPVIYKRRSNNGPRGAA
jgi:predicted acyl esterase